MKKVNVINYYGNITQNTVCGMSVHQKSICAVSAINLPKNTFVNSDMTSPGNIRWRLFVA